jgi:hypothetical protein
MSTSIQNLQLLQVYRNVETVEQNGREFPPQLNLTAVDGAGVPQRRTQSL